MSTKFLKIRTNFPTDQYRLLFNLKLILNLSFLASIAFFTVLFTVVNTSFVGYRVKHVRLELASSVLNALTEMTLIKIQLLEIDFPIY